MTHILPVLPATRFANFMNVSATAPRPAPTDAPRTSSAPLPAETRPPTSLPDMPSLVLRAPEPTGRLDPWMGKVDQHPHLRNASAWARASIMMSAQEVSSPAERRAFLNMLDRRLPHHTVVALAEALAADAGATSRPTLAETLDALEADSAHILVGWHHLALTAADPSIRAMVVALNAVASTVYMVAYAAMSCRAPSDIVALHRLVTDPEFSSLSQGDKDLLLLSESLASLTGDRLHTDAIGRQVREGAFEPEALRCMFLLASDRRLRPEQGLDLLEMMTAVTDQNEPEFSDLLARMTKAHNFHVLSERSLSWNWSDPVVRGSIRTIAAASARFDAFSVSAYHDAVQHADSDEACLRLAAYMASTDFENSDDPILALTIHDILESTRHHADAHMQALRLVDELRAHPASPAELAALRSGIHQFPSKTGVFYMLGLLQQGTLRTEGARAAANPTLKAVAILGHAFDQADRQPGANGLPSEADLIMGALNRISGPDKNVIVRNHAPENAGPVGSLAPGIVGASGVDRNPMVIPPEWVAAMVSTLHMPLHDTGLFPQQDPNWAEAVRRVARGHAYGQRIRTGAYPTRSQLYAWLVSCMQNSEGFAARLCAAYLEHTFSDPQMGLFFDDLLALTGSPAMPKTGANLRYLMSLDPETIDAGNQTISADLLH